jgi:hypothetical protein
MKPVAKMLAMIFAGKESRTNRDGGVVVVLALVLHVAGVNLGEEECERDDMSWFARADHVLSHHSTHSIQCHFLNISLAAADVYRQDIALFLLRFF